MKELTVIREYMSKKSVTREQKMRSEGVWEVTLGK